MVCFKVCFFLLPLWMICSQEVVTIGQGYTVPQMIFFRIVRKHVPTVLSLTHPQDFQDEDEGLSAFRLVCKDWKRAIDERFDFKTLEAHFVGVYQWPCKQFLEFFNNGYYKQLENVQVVQESLDKQKNERENYAQIVEIVQGFNNQIGHSNPVVRQTLQRLIGQRAFFGPLALLLHAGKFEMWCDIFKYFFLWTDHLGNVLNNIPRQLVKNECIYQYVKYSERYGRACNTLEPFIYAIFKLQITENFLKTYNAQKTLFDFDYQSRMEKELQDGKSVKLFVDYLNAGGTFPQELQERVFDLIYLDGQNETTNDVPIQERTALLKAVISSYGTKFFHKKLFYMLERQIYIRDSSVLDEYDNAALQAEIDYPVFLSNLKREYLKWVTRNSLLRFSYTLGVQDFVIQQFLEEYQKVFTNIDGRGKSFLYYTLHLLSQKDSNWSGFLGSLLEHLAREFVKANNALDLQARTSEYFELFKKILPLSLFNFISFNNAMNEFFKNQT